MPSSRGGQNTYECSFCGKAQGQVKRLIAGPDRVFICDECVTLCSQIITDETPAAPTRDLSGLARSWMNMLLGKTRQKRVSVWLCIITINVCGQTEKVRM